MAKSSAYALAWIALAASACALDWNFADGGASGDAGGDGPPGADASLDAATDGAPVDSGGGTDSGSSGDADAASSGCRASSQCKPGEFCHYPDHRCGQGAAGVCLTFPTGCPPSGPYACTCAGTVDVSGACPAEAKGNDVSINGCSSPPPGAPCGYLYCVTPCMAQTVDGEAFYSCP